MHPSKWKLLYLGAVASLVASMGCTDSPLPTHTLDPPDVEFVSEAELRGGFLYRVAWSPVGLKLLFRGIDGLRVFDAEDPSSESHLVVEHSVTYASWSPDGRWITCKIQEPEDYRLGLSSLFAVSVTGASLIPLVESVDFDHHLWAADGNIYYWDARGDRHQLAPPDAWRRGYPDVSLGTHYLLSVFDPDRRTFSPRVFVTNPPRMWVLPGTEAATWVLPRDAMPDGSRFLLTILEGDVQSAVVSTYGVKLTTFPPSSAEGGFSATSFSAKGRYIAGFDSTDDGHALLSSELQIADAYGRWIAPVANASAAMQPYFANSGLGLAFMDPFTGIIHVGHLEIGYR